MNKPQLSPLQGETPVQGEITDRLLTGQILPSSRPTNKAATAVVVVILLLLMLLAGAMTFLLWPRAKKGVTEYPDMNLTEYLKRVGTRELNPTGASHIYYQKWQEGGQSDTWVLMDISPDYYASLLARKERQMSELNVPKAATAKTAIPEPWRRAAEDRWRQPGVEPPLWWVPENAGKGSKCTRWQVQDTPTTAKGSYWVYDDSAGTGRLWIWDWRGRARLGAGSSEEESEEAP